jgi:hypothetical protein
VRDEYENVKLLVTKKETHGNSQLVVHNDTSTTHVVLKHVTLCTHLPPLLHNGYLLLERHVFSRQNIQLADDVPDVDVVLLPPLDLRLQSV